MYALWNNHHNKSSYHPITIQSYDLFFSNVCDENFSHLFSWQLASILFTLKSLLSGKNHHYVLCICEFCFLCSFGLVLGSIFKHTLYYYIHFIALSEYYIFSKMKTWGNPTSSSQYLFASCNSLLTALPVFTLHSSSLFSTLQPR